MEQKLVASLDRNVMSARVRERERARPGWGFRQPSRRFLSPARRSGGEGPYAGEAETGREQGEWIWVRNRRRKALGPASDGRNGQRQGNGQGGMASSTERRDDQEVQHGYRSRSGRREESRFTPSRARVLHGTVRGRSRSLRYGRPFSCSREDVSRQRQAIATDQGYHSLEGRGFN